MWTDDLTWLACPTCGDDLALTDNTLSPDSKRVHVGLLECGSCNEAFPITHGIPRLLPGDSQPKHAAIAKTAQQFGDAWTLYAQANSHPYDDATCTEWLSPLTTEDFHNAVVLDVGTGLGGFASYAAKYGAQKVFGIDLSHAIDAAHPLLEQYSNLTLLQADLNHLPFKPGCFDVAFSIGVLHHTENPEAGFGKLYQSVKPMNQDTGGGKVLFWVYGKEGNTFVRYGVEPLRKLTRHIPVNMVKAFLGWPLGVTLWLFMQSVYRLASLTTFTQRWLPYTDYFHWLRGQGLPYTVGMITDQLIAPTTHYLSKQDLTGWFQQQGIQDYQLIPRNGMSWTGLCKR